ncbi:MAG: methylated-DNA--[Selenomonadales bacterium]|nr:methylated-DNA--[protein]-cysteine S-methyltransferase [Selenomonadales bacterium]
MADRVIASPIGNIYLAAYDGALIAVRTHHLPESCLQGNERDERILDQAEKQLGEYFRGERRTFDLPLTMKGTPFQHAVWQATITVPYGRTATYGDIARMIGNERAARAVGMAENKNPFHIIVPCHRIIGANGHLTGYAGGTDIKRTLLLLERTAAT